MIIMDVVLEQNWQINEVIQIKPLKQNLLICSESIVKNNKWEYSTKNTPIFYSTSL